MSHMRFITAQLCEVGAANFFGATEKRVHLIFSSLHSFTNEKPDRLLPRVSMSQNNDKSVQTEFIVVKRYYFPLDD